ncbi:hypothetical protein [Lactobacillus sp. M0390]|uniref:hypothetical protein n=1 Tax=Lactobacillus sp. M0390 TaxID=2751026 RepID=UPI0018DD91AE|nr:hypothetical protein [Lactobacillus sp. M0390]MBH9985173.1 hypothetical protein [Lactobacillus sp. M0390]
MLHIQKFKERILQQWQHILYAGFGTYPKNRKLLIASLLIVIAGLVLTIIVLSLPERLPGI